MYLFNIRNVFGNVMVSPPISRHTCSEVPWGEIPWGDVPFKWNALPWRKKWNAPPSGKKSEMPHHRRKKSEIPWVGQKIEMIFPWSGKKLKWYSPGRAKNWDDIPVVGQGNEVMSPPLPGGGGMVDRKIEPHITLQTFALVTRRCPYRLNPYGDRPVPGYPTVGGVR